LGYRIYKSIFEAGHFIEGHPKCGVQHGHSYHLDVKILEPELLTHWVDFADIKHLVDNFVQTTFDHQYLGNKSAEQIATDIAAYLTDHGHHGHLILMETEKFGVETVF